VGTDTYVDGQYKNGDNVVLIPHGLEGYTFVQWEFEGVMVSTEREFCFTMKPQLAGTYTAVYKPKKFKIDMFSSEIQLNVSGEVEYGTKITLVSGPTPEYGLECRYWYSRADEIAGMHDIDFEDGFYMPAADICIYYSTVRAAWYNISYNLDGGYFVDEYRTIYCASDLPYTLPTPVKIGYTFLGWTTSMSDSPNLNMTINSVTTGDLTFYANWQPIDDGMKNAVVDPLANGSVLILMDNGTYSADTARLKVGSTVNLKVFSGNGFIVERVCYRLQNSDIEYDIQRVGTDLNDENWYFIMPDVDIFIFAEIVPKIFDGPTI
jgi:uncharacterized repeat protein (TIGR02543 family)